MSKKDNRVYVRQGLAPVMEAPATIRNPETPLGTHIYIATSRVDDSSLGWSVVTLPHSAKGAERALTSAVQALERVELSADVSARISELLWTGGSLIISDQALSDETSDVGTTSSSRCGDPLAGAITTVGHQQADRLNSRLQRAHSPTRVERLQQETGEPLRVRICKCCLSTNDTRARND